MLEDLRRVTESSLEIERQAALLALSQCSDPAASDLLSRFPVETAAIARGELSWDLLSHAVEGSQGIISEIGEKA